MSDDEKLKRLLDMDFLRISVGNAHGNYKIIMFLCEKDNLEMLLKYSIGVPEEPENQNEAFKYPNVA